MLSLCQIATVMIFLFFVSGNWSFHPSVKEEIEAEETHLREEEEDYFYLDDEDADRDESSDSESSECQADASLQQVSFSA